MPDISAIIQHSLAAAESNLRYLKRRESDNIVHGDRTRPTEREMIAAKTAVEIFECLSDGIADAEKPKTY